jgi:pyruvate dehydrogenase E1 component alpha subunit
MLELPDLYRQMARARAFELAVADLWARGLVSGEMHLGTGEEAVAAGVLTHLGEADALSLAHRASPGLVVRGVPLVPLLRELLGRTDGMCGARAGHMHVMSRAHRIATTGIVGASVPIGAGFALAAKRLRKGSIAVAITGEGAMNQGMVLETLNLAAVWQLPLLLVCIDNGWSITTRSASVTAGHLIERVRAFGWTLESVDGTDVAAVHRTAGGLVERCRRGKGPVCLHAVCPRLDGHFLGDPLVDQARHPTGEAARRTLRRVVSAAVQSGGGGVIARAASVGAMMGTIARARGAAARDDHDDPMRVVERALGRDACHRVDAEVEREIGAAVAAALAEEPGHG